MNSLRANSPAGAMQPSDDQFWNQNQGNNIVPEHKQIPEDQGTTQPQSQVIGQVDPNQQEQFAQNQFGQQNAQQQFGQQQYGQPQYAQQPIGGMVNQYQPQMMQSGGKSRMAAGILGLLLGGLGIHNFYLGYTGKGLAQLLITVLSFGLLAFVSGIWGLIEGIMILTDKNYLDADGFPLEG